LIITKILSFVVRHTSNTSKKFNQNSSSLLISAALSTSSADADKPARRV